MSFLLDADTLPLHVRHLVQHLNSTMQNISVYRLHWSLILALWQCVPRSVISDRRCPTSPPFATTLRSHWFHNLKSNHGRHAVWYFFGFCKESIPLLIAVKPKT